MSGHIKVDGAWKTVDSVSAKVAGAWNNVDSGYTKVDGVWNQWYSSVAPPAYELIESSILTINTASISFSAIPQDYKHIQIRSVLKNTAGTNSNVTVNLFGVTNSYATHRLFGDGSTVTSNSILDSGTSFTLPLRSNFSTVENSFTPSIIDILDYTSTTKNKTVRAFHGRAETGQNQINLSSAFFVNTSAISNIIISASNNALLTGSRISLYGIRG